MRFDRKNGCLDYTYADLEQKLGRAMNDQEIANAFGVYLEEYYEMVAKFKAVTLLSIYELSVPNQQDKKKYFECLENMSSKNPFMQLKSKGVRDLSIKNIKNLPEKQKIVMSLYY